MASDNRTRTGGGTDLPAGTGDSAGGPEARDLFTIGELARAVGVTVRALRFYQSKGLLGQHGAGNAAKVFGQDDRHRLVLILQGKRLGFTLNEIREFLPVRESHRTKVLPIGRRKCVDQINLLERQRRDIDEAIAELRRIYTEMFTESGAVRTARMPGTH